MLIRLALVVSLIGVMSSPVPAQARSQTFVFRNNVWVNLHQFLRGEVFRRSTNRPPGLDPASLTDAERAAWSSALDVYVEVAKGHLVFDERARRIANTLGMTGDVAALPDGALDADVAAALNAAAPIYRAHVWPNRQRDNEVWITSARALVDRHRTAMTAALASVYGATWPPEPYLVDVVGETGANSAVTHHGPAGFVAHIQASAGSARNTGDAPLELLFHEASHVDAIEGRIVRLIKDESERQQLAVAPELWHYVIMFTTGEITRRELANAGKPGYVSYADRYDQIPPTERAALERHWLPYLDRRVSFEQALRDLVRAAAGAG